MPSVPFALKHKSLFAEEADRCFVPFYSYLPPTKTTTIPFYGCETFWVCDVLVTDWRALFRGLADIGTNNGDHAGRARCFELESHKFWRPGGGGGRHFWCIYTIAMSAKICVSPYRTMHMKGHAVSTVKPTLFREHPLFESQARGEEIKTRRTDPGTPLNEQKKQKRIGRIKARGRWRQHCF